jgi:hypothetical protein
MKKNGGENGNHVAAVLKIGEPQLVPQLLAGFACMDCLADKIVNKNLH